MWRALWSARVLIMLGGALWLLGLAALSLSPFVAPPAIEGLYRPEPGPPPFQWTSNRVVVPIRGRAGPTRVALKLRALPEPDTPATPVTLTTDTGVAATLSVTAASRAYDLWLPANTSTLTLQTAVRRLRSDSRWLGVQLLELSVKPSGLPLREAVIALLVPLIGLPAIAGLRWLARHGYGLAAGLATVGLGIRIFEISTAPPGFARDELVSLVDAWFLVRTGRDHLGHWLPIAEFEAYGDWISPLLTYLETPLAIFGIHPLAARLLTAVIGALAVPAIYALARRLEMPRVAAAGAALAAACSPWLVFLSRAAKPPALVPLAWVVCLWAALGLVRYGRRRDAFWLAGAAGVALYAYPTLKLAVPLLVGWAVALALYEHGWSRWRAWLPPALLLALLWLPFALSTLFNSSSSARFARVGIQAPTFVDWALAVWQRYQIYFNPIFYYFTGDPDPSHGVPNRGVELSTTAPLVMLGLLALAHFCVRGPRRSRSASWLIAGALAIAPLPASLTNINPHTFRAAPIAPLYALLVGYGITVLWRALARITAPTWRHGLQLLAVGSFVVLLAWQSAGWMRELTQVYAPSVDAERFSDGLTETIRRAVSYAPDYDDVWLDITSISKPYIYVLAAPALPPRVAQQAIEVQRVPPQPNFVSRIDRYHFGNLRHVPGDLPVLEALTDQFGNPAFVIQAWEHDRRRSLVVRAMPAAGR